MTDIDPELQQVMLREADGDRSVVAVSDRGTLGRMIVGDKVRVDLKKSLGFELLEPGQSIEAEKFNHEALPAFVTFGRKAKTTLKIVKVASGGESATCRSKDGSMHKIEADTKAKQTELSRLHPGDVVAASCTEKLSIKLLN
ncbi:MAG: hypothetical protein QM778_28525 [Myxococcales bacterium]